ncbi:hypothetical protein LSCM1_07874 [Leishmania martiniquensis]|uniref:Primase C-terminal 2 domain-containing protein n=1 Tax=Leishmania martiniquensis TaxID=1580590 RepID=A0A836HE52_9TRYP|nr:hypothetical protein LSCM1_07874 [Leishmania martiniquensis]
MRRCERLLQRCLGGVLHNSAHLFASSRSHRSGRRGGGAEAAATIPSAVEADGELLRSTEAGTRPTADRRGRQRHPPAQLLDSLDGGDSQGSASDAVNPVERLLRKHEVAAGGGSANAIPVPGKSRPKAKNGLVVPPTSAEEPMSGGGNDGDGAGLDGPSSMSSSVAPTATQQQQHLLTNPFRGLRADVSRSYRVDQLMEEATAADLLFARQEKKSTAFSFLHFRAGEPFYRGHWGSVAEMQAQLDASAAAAQMTMPKRISAPYVRGTPIPGLTLFNNDLGLQSPLVQCRYPLIVAQRLLLFPDNLRHFHTICGREDVPCDFYADLDLPGESAAQGEKTLLEVLNYLQVRLPGVGFTDPFFLVLTNAVPSSDKISYHIHARSLTFLTNRTLEAVGEATPKRNVKRKPAGRKTKAAKKKGSAASAPATPADLELGEDALREGQDEDAYDDLSDMVSAVEGSGKGAAVPKVIVFQDYRTVKLIAEEVNQTLGREVIDHNCYRPNGMLRCAFSAKLASAQDHNYRLKADSAAEAARKRLVPLVTASDPALQQRLSETESVLRTMTDPEILELTFVTRHLDVDPKVIKAAHERAVSLSALESHAPAGSEEHRRCVAALHATTKHRFKLIRQRHITGPQGAQAVEYDAYGNAVSPFLTEAAKWRRFKAVTAKLRTLPPRAAESYDVWVRVGLALHNFSNEDHVFEEWVLFSLKSPLKYSREVCRRKWLQFERNPDALNWRRGYNYLNSTVWRQVG